MKNKTTKQVRISSDVHKMFKLYATQKGMSMTDVIDKILKERVKINNIKV